MVNKEDQKTDPEQCENEANQGREGGKKRVVNGPRDIAQNNQTVSKNTHKRPQHTLVAAITHEIAQNTRGIWVDVWATPRW